MTNEEAIEYLSGKYMPVIPNLQEEKECEKNNTAIDMAIFALESQRWISVEERLPEKDGKYLVTVAGDNVVDPYVTTWFFWNGKFEDFQYYSSRHITHWRTIPEPPKEENT